MKTIYTKPSLMALKLTKPSLLIGSGDNAVDDNKIHNPGEIASKTGNIDFSDESDDEEY